MYKLNQIEHQGFIKEIHENRIFVSIISKAACLSCTLKSACNISDVEEKIIEINTENYSDYIINEEVDVFYSQSLGFRALLLGYLLPFLFVIFTLITLISITKNELISGLISLGILIPYYLILYMKRDKIKKTFAFSVKKRF
jgi:sigma-E factor negative regulatory protein RseC